MSSDRSRRKPSTFRCRDLAAILAVLIVGAALLYTAFLRGAPPSRELAFVAFFAAVALVSVGYGGGMLMDRFAERHPILARPFFSGIVFLLLPPMLVALALLGWKHREPLRDFADNKSEQMLTSVTDLVMGQ